MRESARQALVAALPVAAAIGVFGTIFGAAGTQLIGAPLTIASSILIFSGAVQLTLIGLLIAGADATALLITAATLNLRNLLLGAVVRPHLPSSILKRLGLAWFVIDETVGLSVANPGQAASVLFSTGAVCYIAWIAGTVLGAIGGAVAELRPLAAAMFPVLFVGLASLTIAGRDLLVRAVAAALLTLILSTLFPGVRSVAPALAAALVALPGRHS